MQVTRTLVQSYFSLVRASLQDSVPKAVMHFLVLYVQRGLQQHLIRTLYKWAPLFAVACRHPGCDALLTSHHGALASLLLGSL